MQIWIISLYFSRQHSLIANEQADIWTFFLSVMVMLQSEWLSPEFWSAISIAPLLIRLFFVDYGIKRTGVAAAWSIKKSKNLCHADFDQ